MTQSPSERPSSRASSAGSSTVSAAAGADTASSAARESAGPGSADAGRAERGPAEREVLVRRAPSVVAFMVLGGVLGLLVAVFSTILGPVDQAYTLGAIFGTMALLFGTAGAVLGAVVGLLLEWRSRKKAQRFRAVRVDDDAL